MASNEEPRSLGPNAWLVEELAQNYKDNPKSVPEDWRHLFSDAEGSPAATPSPDSPAAALNADSPAPPTDFPNGSKSNGASSSATVPPAPAAPAAAPPAEAPESSPAAPKVLDSVKEAAPELGTPLRGAAARIVTNMEASLSVPTATSFREVPAKLLEINRKVLNNHLKRVRGGKVSFTHIIGYAIVRAIREEVPAMASSYAVGSDGKPRVVQSGQINVGIAVDQAKSDGSRSLIVPVLKDTQNMSFSQFLETYEAAIAKVRSNNLKVDDLMGANVSITNPGTIGTIQSVPRLMPGQGLIVGLGGIGYPTEYQAADPVTLAELGISKIMTISSTYDHRIIQGAESGLFLKRVHELLLGEHNFYSEIFGDMRVPYEAVQWRKDAVSSNNDVDMAIAKQHGVNTLINQYRVRGHLIANTNPLSDGPKETHPELDPATFGLTIWDLDRRFLTGTTEGIYAAIDGVAKQMKLGDILGVLRDAYCRTVGVEYMHIADPTEKRWIQEQVEVPAPRLDREDLHHILERLSTAEAFEKFLAARYVGQKRFGLEGAESAVPILDAILSDAADAGIERGIIGMAHRGRLNVLTNIMKKGHRDLFKEFEGAVDQEAIQGSGDVKYHLGFTGSHTSRNGNAVEVELAANPSHLEAVDPVVIGMARAYMDQSDAGNYPILPILIHGDAAFAGQGVVAETLNLSQVKGYKVGGTIHLIINNQLGYTTAPHHSRSSEYSTDVAKMVQAPIIHVNADDPEACVRVAQLAFAYRQRFNKDVVIDMIGYRRHGHNEGDDPSYTQPVMYRKIGERPSARTLFTQALIDRGELSIEEAEKAIEYFQQLLQLALDDTRESAPPEGILAKPSPPPVGVLPHVDTSVPRETLDTVYEALSFVPEGFEVHPKLARQFVARDKMWASGEVDWALGEAFAYGSLLVEGTSVRLAGQDSRRGTFAHRHATLSHYQDGSEFTPLAELGDDDTDFWVYDSTLSEYAGLGFEYGYSLVDPDCLTLWEAQFGDFVNGAQIIIDQFLVAAEDKWNEASPLVMLLPHGYEGQGPEHSSGRLERFLLLCAEDNIQVANPTTSAQLFHLLRRQIVRDINKPLVVFTPKSGLRAKYSRNSVDQFTSGSFEEVLEPSPVERATAVGRVVFASGKVAAEAEQYRDDNDISAAVVRVEQLYPWPFDDIAAALSRYPNATEIVWLQEEPENMGAWNSVKGRLYEAHGDTHKIRRVSRTESGSPATGSRAIHMQEQASLLRRAFQ
ncbi:MAG: multifunctional oxoglutarate decarboxylase/oxoglutarate dehydrogenase thiamine pyrophosphate-binding subunit/dihydrolipoyllysine-residue succinyltransferase subunit [Acidimicrobiales bacterium]